MNTQPAVVPVFMLNFSVMASQVLNVHALYLAVLFLSWLLTKCEVNMAGYWPSCFLRVYGPRRSQGP